MSWFYNNIRKNAKYVFPNFITMINLLLGCIAIVIVFRGENEYNAGWIILVAAIFDLLDGMAARALEAQSKFGANLDSLADVVSFGIAPSFIIFNWFTLVLTNLSTQSTFELVTAESWQNIVLFSSLLFAVAGASRLARFNAQESDVKTFNGMPIPAAALVVASLWIMVGNTDNELIRAFLLNIYFVYGVLILLAFLMISNITMISFKMDGFNYKNNFYQYTLLFLSIVFVVFFEIAGLLFSITAYVLLSVIRNTLEKGKE